jgi:8-oxo-dGTP pyrophosphatase MutT (NUDIX family)
LNKEPDGPILGAGGIVRGTGACRGQILIVRRKRHGGDVGLPKGKVQPHETLPAAAVREVEEETGYRTRVVGYAGTNHYHVGIQPKAVCYFIMDIVESAAPKPVGDEEIETIDWLSPTDARGKLSYSEDRDLIAALFNLPRK